MDGNLRKAVEEGDVVGVRRRLEEVEAALLGGTNEAGLTVLHLAAAKRHPTSIPIVELLVNAMDEEQISKRSRKGETVIHKLLTDAYGAQLYKGLTRQQWLRGCKEVSAVMVAKMTEAAVFFRRGGALRLLASKLQLAAVRVALEKFADRLERQQRIKDTLFEECTSGQPWCSEDEGEEATLHRLLDVAAEESLLDGKLAYRIACRSFPVSVLLRVLEIQQSSAVDLSQPGYNVLHAIAMFGREELLDAVIPFVTPAHMQQKALYEGLTAGEIAIGWPGRDGNDTYLRIAARLQTFTKSAVE